MSNGGVPTPPPPAPGQMSEVDPSLPPDPQDQTQQDYNVGTEGDQQPGS